MSTVSIISQFLSIQDFILTPLSPYCYYLIIKYSYDLHITYKCILILLNFSYVLEFLVHIDRVIHSVYDIGYVFVI